VTWLAGNWPYVLAAAFIAAGLAILTLTYLAWAGIDRHRHRAARVQPPPPLLDVEAIAEPGTYDDPPIPPERLNAVGGWAQVGARTVHRTCAEARRDGQPHRICAHCAPRLTSAADTGTTR
jgi:hypothetical protein